MPSRRRAHVDGELDLPAGRSRSFGNELRLDPPRLCERWDEQECDDDQNAAEHGTSYSHPDESQDR
jgi:hypothetical protein